MRHAFGHECAYGYCTIRGADDFPSYRDAGGLMFGIGGAGRVGGGRFAPLSSRPGVRCGCGVGRGLLVAIAISKVI